MVLKVFRWSPGFRERIQRFWVPAKDGMTVLDALVDAQRRLDPTLAFRYACRVGMCGSCGMVINGRERWACRTLLKSLKTRIVTVRPLYHFPLIRDLVVDLAPLAEQHHVVPGDQGAFQLREHGVLEAEDARPRVTALGQRGQQIFPDFGLDAPLAMTGGLQLADGPGQIMRLGHHSTLRLLSSRGSA